MDAVAGPADAYLAGSDVAQYSYANMMLVSDREACARPLDGTAPLADREGNARNISRKEKRCQQKQVVITLDSLLPDAFRSNPVKNCAGRRSLGNEGRSLHDVLVDAIQCLKAIRARDQTGGVRATHEAETGTDAGITTSDGETKPSQTEASAREVTPDMLRDGLLSSHSLAVIELEMPSWTVASLSPGAKVGTRIGLVQECGERLKVCGRGCTGVSQHYPLPFVQTTSYPKPSPPPLSRLPTSTSPPP
eukprot:Tamp_12777.p1 GENE.Tamp_12777~~Tamp_12777.p1  ORF type:complete len:249 (-),score=15.15 Tamp_12777:1032-1778(-)